MKKIYFIFTALFMAMLVSCSSGVGSKEVNSKEITPTSTEFTSGELAKYIEVVDQPSELTFAEKDGVIATQYISLKVTLRLTKDGIKNVDARDISFTSLLSVAIIILVDENGNKVQDLDIKSEDMLKLKKLLTGSEGDTEEIVFVGEYHNHDDAPKWFEQASQFTPYLTGDISVERSSFDDEENDEATESESSYGNHLAVLSKENILLPSSLKGSVEIVPEDNGNVYVDFDDDFPMVSLTFKLLKKVSTANLVSSYGQLWIVGHAQDAKGRNINDLNPKSISSREWRTGDSDGREFKNFLEGEVGETITLDFHGESNIELFEKDQAKIAQGRATTTEAAKNFAKFKLSISN